MNPRVTGRFIALMSSTASLQSERCPQIRKGTAHSLYDYIYAPSIARRIRVIGEIRGFVSFMMNRGFRTNRGFRG